MLASPEKRAVNRFVLTTRLLCVGEIGALTATSLLHGLFQKIDNLRKRGYFSIWRRRNVFRKLTEPVAPQYLKAIGFRRKCIPSIGGDEAILGRAEPERPHIAKFVHGLAIPDFSKKIQEAISEQLEFALSPPLRSRWPQPLQEVSPNRWESCAFDSDRQRNSR